MAGKKRSKNTIIEELVESPALALDKTLEESKKISKAIQSQPELKKVKHFWHMLGPGLTTGAADDDPSGITTYSQTGARYGFQLLWFAGFTFPLMAVVQEMCARIGLVTGRGLAANVRKHFPRLVLYVCTILLFVANTLNLGADLGAMAKATQLLVPSVDFRILVVIFAGISLVLQIFTTYEKYAKYLKWLALILFAYVLSALRLHLDWRQLIQSAIIPSITISKNQIFLICAILGTTISPYLFFWQTSQEIEEEIAQGKKFIIERQGASGKEIRTMRSDVWIGMFISNLVMFFIIAAAAATLFTSGKTDIQTAADAAEALKPIAGNFAYILFTLGIIGTGMLAVPVLAGSSSYAIAESFGWKYGLYRKLNQARAFYGVIIISTILGLLFNFVGIDPIKTLIYSSVLNGLIAPIILFLIILISSNKRIMGRHVNHPIISGLGWFITGVMILAGSATILSFFWQ